MRVQCERMAVLGPVWYRMKRFLRSHRSLSLQSSPRGHTGLHTCRLSLSLSKSMYAPQAPKQSLQKENTQSDPPQVSPHQYHSFHVTRIHLKSSPRSSVRQKPYTSLSYPGFRDSSLRLSQMAQQMFIIEGTLASLLFSLLSSHCYTLFRHTHGWLVSRHSSPRELERIHDWGRRPWNPLSWWVGSSQRSCIREVLCEPRSKRLARHFIHPRGHTRLVSKVKSHLTTSPLYATGAEGGVARAPSSFHRSRRPPRPHHPGASYPNRPRPPAPYHHLHQASSAAHILATPVVSPTPPSAHSGSALSIALYAPTRSRHSHRDRPKRRRSYRC